MGGALMCLHGFCKCDYGKRKLYWLCADVLFAFVVQDDI